MHEDATANRNYNLSGGEPIMLIDMFREIGRQLNVQNTFISCPFWLPYAGAWTIWLLTFKKIDMREKVQRLVEPRVYSHEEASTDFGYCPLNFSEGIQSEITMYKKQRKG